MSKKETPLIMRRDMVKPVADAFTEAFQDDPLFKWLIPDDCSRRSLLPLFFNYRVLHGVLYGEVHATSQNAEGAAIWLPHTQIEMTQGKMSRCGAENFIQKADPITLERLKVFGMYADELHHQYTPFPHWILFLIGVRPELQGRGYAKLLLNSMFERLDRDRIPCFLETQTPANVEIYQKYGFAVKHHGHIPGTNIPHWAMLRESKQ